MFRKPNDIPGFLNVSGFVDEEPKYDDKQRPFSFTSKISENSFNWENVYNWDPATIKKEHDAEKMQSILNEFVKCNFSAYDYRIIQNPLIFRLLQVLQIVVEYIAHSQTEIQTLYGKTAHENTVLKTSISRYKFKNERLISALRSVKEHEKCPVCSSFFDSDISLDRHIHKNHFKIYDLWQHVRENKEFSAQEEVEKLNRQIDAMRILIKRQQMKSAKAEKNKVIKQKEEEEKQKENEKSQEDSKISKKEEECSNESVNQANIFELTDTDEGENDDNDGKKKYKFIIDPDYQPFHRAVHHDDGPYLIFQEMNDYSITIEPKEITEQRNKKGIESKYYKKAKKYLSNSPPKVISENQSHYAKNIENLNKNNINLEYQSVYDGNQDINSKKIKDHLHDQAHEVKMSHKELGPKWKFRKRIEKELKEEVPDIIPKSTISQIFDQLNYYAKKNFVENKIESESYEEEEEEEEMFEEIELTSANYSSIQFSSEKAEYYSQGGGGTTRNEQAVPRLYNPGGKIFPIKKGKLKQNKTENTKKKIDQDDEDVFSSSTHESKVENPESENQMKPSTNTEENEKKPKPSKSMDNFEEQSISSITSSQNQNSSYKPPAQPSGQQQISSVKEDTNENDSASFVETDFKKMAKTVPNELKKDELASPKNKRRRVRRQKGSKQNINDQNGLGEVNDTNHQENENTLDQTTKQPKSLPLQHRRRRHKGNQPPIELSPSQPSNRKHSRHHKTSSNPNINDQIPIEEEEEDVEGNSNLSKSTSKNNEIESNSWDEPSQPSGRIKKAKSYGESQMNKKSKDEDNNLKNTRKNTDPAVLDDSELDFLNNLN